MASLEKTQVKSENLGERLCFFSSNGKLSGSGDLGNLVFEGGFSVEKARAAVDNLVENLVIIDMQEKLEFFFPTVILKELRISDSIDINMLGRSGGSSLVERVMARDVSSVEKIEIFGLGIY